MDGFWRLNRFRGCKQQTRVGVYVDAFNLYYGARGICGRGSPNWRWLDLVQLSESLIDPKLWSGPMIDRVVYCTAMRKKEGNLSSVRDQRTYLDALEKDSRVHVKFGQYNPRKGKGTLLGAKDGSRVESPGIECIPSWLHATEKKDPEGVTNLIVSYSSFEEKGSDVNLASHLIIDTLERQIDAAIVISNDGDIQFPLKFVRERIPVGLVNPSKRPTSKMLQGSMDEGVGSHWWKKLERKHFSENQLSSTVEGIHKPADW